MHVTKQLLNDLTLQLATLLRESSRNRARLMAQIEQTFVERGLLSAPGLARSSSPEEFARDVIADNPLLPDYLRLLPDRRLRPKAISSVPELLDKIAV